jgi:hypothetical protein
MYNNNTLSLQKFFVYDDDPVLNNNIYILPLGTLSSYLIIRILITYFTIKNLTVFLKFPFFLQLITMCIIFHVNIK